MVLAECRQEQQQEVWGRGPEQRVRALGYFERLAPQVRWWWGGERMIG